MNKTIKINSCFKKIILFLIIMLFIFSSTALALDIGGKASFFSNLSYYDSDFNNQFASELELELFLPRDTAVDLRNRAVIRVDSSEVDIWFKSLYLRQRLGPFTVKAGRQPISWSYGSLINPVDYSLGAEVLDQEGRAKFVDGIEVYYPVNWGTGITFVTTDQADESDNKWALRGRTTLRGYDLAASYVSVPSSGPGGDMDRYALTGKGDLGPVGVYGVYGKWQDDLIDYDIYQLGTDYSYNFLAGSQLHLQAEYLRITGVEGDLSDFAFFNPAVEEDLNGSGSNSEKIDLINTNINYAIDDFSSIGVMTVSYLGDGSTIFIPNYSYIFSSNLQLDLRGSITAGSEGDALSSDHKGLELQLSYTF